MCPSTLIYGFPIVNIVKFLVILTNKKAPLTGGVVKTKPTISLS